MRPPNPVNRSVALAGAVAASLVLAACAQTPRAQESIAAFTTDGCSLFPNRSFDSKKDWCDCCVVHDLAYWRGGTPDERLAADQKLKACVEERTASPLLAALMYAGVRIGGTPHLNTSFRWGYGWSFGRGYAPLSPADVAAAAEREAQYLAEHSTLSCPR